MTRHNTTITQVKSVHT